MAGFSAFQLLKFSGLILVLYLSCYSAIAKLVSPVTPAEGTNIACAFTNWAQHRPGVGSYTVNDIDPNLCTHLIFAYAGIDGTDVVITEPDDNLPDGLYKQFNDLKLVNPNLKTLLAIGGPGNRSDDFAAMVSDPASRGLFIDNLRTYLRYWKFDGVVIDWEYPSAAEKDSFTSLIQEMNANFELDAPVGSNREKLLLSIAVPPRLPNIIDGFDVPALDDSVDMYNVKAYDYHGPWENVTGLNVPLRSTDGFDVTKTIEYYLDQNATAEKIHVGLATYGRSFTLENTTDIFPGDPADGPGQPGNYTQEAGLLAYYEICTLLDSGYTDTVDPSGVTNYAFDGSGQWFSFDDARLLRFKLTEITNRNLGGAMIWTLDFDDFTGTFCNSGPNPLTYFVANRLLGVTTTTVSTTTAMSTTTTTTPITTTTTTPTTSPLQYGPFPICPTVYGRYPHRSTCNSYILCLASMPFLAHCPTDHIFNPEVEECEDSTTTNYTCVLPPSACSASATGSKIPTPDACDQFFLCQIGEAIRASCNPGEIFNPNTSECEDRSTSGYTCPGDPQALILIADKK